MIVEDLEHWTRDGIDTPAKYDHYMLVTDVFEFTRSVHGYKPHWGNLNEMPDSELERELDSLGAQSEILIAEEAEAEKEDIAEFEAAVASVIENTSAGDRDTAIRWLRVAEQDEQMEYDDNYFEHCNGLPYGYLKGEVMA